MSLLHLLYSPLRATSCQKCYVVLPDKDELHYTTPVQCCLFAPVMGDRACVAAVNPWIALC